MALPDLRALMESVRANAATVPSFTGRLPHQIAERLRSAWKHPIVVREGVVEFQTEAKKTESVPNANILKAAIAVPLYRAMNQYRQMVFEIAKDLSISSKEFRKFGAKKPSGNRPENWEEWESAIDKRADLNDADKENLREFILTPESLTDHKGLARGDWFHPAISKPLGLLVVSTSVVGPLTAAISEDEALYEQLTNLIEKGEATNSASHAATNTIVYGAPGTGKSFALKSLPNITRTVFHSDYRNSDFVGSYKPYRIKSDQNNEQITYRFVPGPFIRAFVNSVKNPSEEHNLIIEEINRANAAAVFGEIFQLLDRSESGESEYRIAVDQSLDDFLAEELGELWSGELYIPGNLFLRASMNSADQGVEPMDSAFKRRWQFIYKPIEFNDDPLLHDDVVPYKTKFYSWASFAEAINEVLRERGVEEDRLLGPYFLSRRELSDKANLKNYISGKVFIYLWDDVLRHTGRDWIFHSELRSFQHVSSEYLRGAGVFSTSVETHLDPRDDRRNLVESQPVINASSEEISEN